MAGDVAEIARYLRNLDQRIAALERLEHGSGGGGLDFDDIDSLSPIASLALDDTLAVYDESASAAGKATVQKMWDSLGALGAGNPEEDDLFVFADASDDVTKRTTIANIWDIVNGFPQASELGDDDYFYAFTEDIGSHSRIQPPKILDYIKTKDGTGSGLDADLLDGSHASAFAAASHSHDASAITTGTIDDARIPSGIARDSEVSAAYAPISHTHSTSAITDYADGTWTPTLTFGGNAVGITYGTRVGTYVKIGKLVYITCTITLTSKGSSTGNAFVEGLPFNCNTTTNAQHRLTNFMDVPNGDISMASIGASQADRIALVRVTVATQAAAVMTNTQFSNTSRVWVTGVYSTD